MTSDAKQKPQTPPETYIILGCGAGLGLALLIHPLIFVSWWWNPLMDALREGEKVGIWKPALVLFSMLGGLAVMFACLQPARQYSRSDPLMRRVVYGYNSVLTGILVLLLLVIGNVGIHVWAPRYLDATEGGFHSISDVTRTFVTELERPAQVYVILQEAQDSRLSMMTLLAQLHEVNPRNFYYEDLSPTLNQSRARELQARFPQLHGEGLIVAVGEPPEKNYSFIPAAELMTEDRDPMTGQRKRREFAGEVRLMQELNQLSVNKKMPVVYVTQGHGEPDLAGAREDGLSNLVFKLKRENYDIRPLKVEGDPKDAKIPDDADLVMVVGPKRSMADVIPALGNYLRSPRGRMVVFLGPTPPNPDDKKHAMTATGLENLLQEYNVDVTNEQIFTFGLPDAGGLVLDADPELVTLTPNISAIEARQPIAVTFQNKGLRWLNCREIRATTKSPGFDAQPIMGSYGYVWTESDLEAKSFDQHRLMQRDRAEFKRRCTPDPLPLVVAVTQVSPDPGKPGTGRTPKMLVYGSYLFLTNPYQAAGAGTFNADLTRSSIDWCRERYSSIGVQPKTYNSFVIVPTNVSVPKLIVIPSVLMLMSVLGFGLVVWNARRR